MPCPDEVIDTLTPTALKKRSRSWLRLTILGCVAGLSLAGIVEAARILLGNNFHTLIAGQAYRCAQLGGPELERIIRAHRIRTVINLRGCCSPWPWYMDESRATLRAGISQEDICFSAGRLPSVSEVRRLLQVLERTEYPVLLHCRRGADRTGLASAIVLLLQTDVGLDEAAYQLGLRYGHVALGRPACLGRFLKLYGDWLLAQGRPHSRDRFRRWLEREYCPGECRCRVEALDVPASLPVGKPFAMRFRMVNTSVGTWRLQPETNAGIHGRAVLWNDADQQLATVRAGLFHQTVAPGDAIDLTLAFPALKHAGRYRIMVDMIDEQQCWFFQTGSQPLELSWKRVNKLIRLAISVSLLGWLASRMDWAQLGQVFGRLRLEWWLAAVGLYLFTQVVSAFRWQLLAGPLGFQQPLRRFTGYYFVGMFFNLFLPTSVGGDVVRALYLDGGSGRKLPAFLSTFVDRFSGLLVLLALACVAMALCPIELPSWIAWCVWGAGLCAVAGLVLLPGLTRWTGRFPRIRRLTEDAQLYLDHPRLLVGATGLSLVVQGANVIVVWLAGRAMGIAIPDAYYWILVPMVTLLTLVPISLNGMGVREGGMALFLAPLGVGATEALSLAFLWFAVFTSASVLGGGVYLFGNFQRPQVRDDHGSVDCDSHQGRARQLEAAA